MSLQNEKSALTAAVRRLEEHLPTMSPQAQDAAAGLLAAVTPLIVRLADHEDAARKPS